MYTLHQLAKIVGQMVRPAKDFLPDPEGPDQTWTAEQLPVIGDVVSRFRKDKDWLTRTELARLLDTSYSRVDKAIVRGYLPAGISHHNTMYWKRSDLDAIQEGFDRYLSRSHLPPAHIKHIDLAETLGVATSTLQKWWDRKIIPDFRVPWRGLRIMPLDKVEPTREAIYEYKKKTGVTLSAFVPPAAKSLTPDSN